jgi:hypothetical protein
MAKISQRQVLGLIEPKNTNHPKWVGFKFAQISGGEITAAVERIYEGGDKFPSVLCAPYEIGDITLTAHYDASSGAPATFALTFAVQGITGGGTTAN